MSTQFMARYTPGRQKTSVDRIAISRVRRDELLFGGPETEMEAASELVEREMCHAFELHPPLAVDVGVGKDWLAAKYRVRGEPAAPV